ncbi:MAG TPA: hypothetical protein VFZ66_07135 [Herpetosiphonaceae bacterium]
MHHIKLMRRRFPRQSATITGILLLAALSALVIGIGLLLLP